MKKAEELTAAKNHQGGHQCARTGESVCNSRPAEGNRGEDKGGDCRNEQGQPFRPDGAGSTAGTAGIYTDTADTTSATAGTAAACIYTVSAASDAGTGSARTAETTTGIHAASATTGNMAVATTAATTAGKTADTAARAICPADRRTAAFPTSISAAA